MRIIARMLIILSIKNKGAIRGVVCLLVQGFEPSDLGLPAEISSTMPQPLEASKTASTSKLPVFQELFSHYCPTRAPGEPKKLHSVLQTLLNCPLTGDQKAKRQKEKERAASSSTGGVDPAIYLLPAEKFLGNGYVSPSYPFDTASRIRSSHSSNGAKQANGAIKAEPVPFERWQRSDGMIETPQGEYGNDEQPPLLKIIGIDCEMVRTAYLGHLEVPLTDLTCSA
jgi:RNA exonuclease 1